jgi:hypothetical protein
VDAAEGLALRSLSIAVSEIFHHFSLSHDVSAGAVMNGRCEAGPTVARLDLPVGPPAVAFDVLRT